PRPRPARAAPARERARDARAPAALALAPPPAGVLHAQIALPPRLLLEARRLAGDRLRRALPPARRGGAALAVPARPGRAARSAAASGHDRVTVLEKKTRVLVVGTGAGGAVCAKELACAGLSVLALEAGPAFRAEEVDQREETSFPRLYAEGGRRG